MSEKEFIVQIGNGIMTIKIRKGDIVIEFSGADYSCTARVTNSRQAWDLIHALSFSREVF